MSKKQILSVFLTALIISAAGFFSADAHGNTARNFSEEIIEYNLKKTSAISVQEWIDGELTDNAGIGSEWYIIALSNHGRYEFSDYKKALNDYLYANEVGSASSRLKYALTLVAIGDKTNPYIDNTLGNSIGEQGIMSLVFGLHLLNNGYSCDDYSVNELIGEILSLQHADAGFSVTGDYGDVDVTAMTVQALAPHYDDSPKVRASVDKALDFLSARQLENGGYSAYGVENPESSAQVIIAISSLGIDVCDDDRFIKNGKTVFDGMNKFVLADGSFCHREGGASDQTATAQALCSSVAYENMKNGKSLFYIINYCGITDEETTGEITAANTITITETSLSVKNTSGTANTVIETDTAKEKQTENTDYKNGSEIIIIISVCTASLMICAALFATKKHKLIPIVIAVAVVALGIGLSESNNKEPVGTVTICINCEVIKENNKKHIPKDGIILKETEVEIENGDTVYDVLSEVCKKENILFSANMGYIEGINNIFETDFGKSSGWLYFINGEAPPIGCESYKLADGDKIEWHYTCNSGKDLDINFEK